MPSCCSNGSTLFGALAIAGLLGIGVAGYQYLTPSEAQTAATTQVNHADEHAGCALCPSSADAKVTLASDAKGECVEAKAGCSEAMAACQGAKVCSEGEKVNAINAANVEKTDACAGSESCAKGEACCKKTGEGECKDKGACCSGEKKSEPTQPTSGGGF
jgi:hypothetical protein